MAELPTVFTIKDLVSRYSITPSGLRTWIGKLKARGYDMEPEVQEGQPVYNTFQVETLDALRNHIRRGRAVSSFPRQDVATNNGVVTSGATNSNGVAASGLANSNGVAASGLANLSGATNSSGVVDSNGPTSAQPPVSKIPRELMDLMLEDIRDEAGKPQNSYSLRELVFASYDDLSTVVRVHGYSRAIALFEKHGVSIKIKTLQQYLFQYRSQQKQQSESV
jgi:hypothetical protein